MPDCIPKLKALVFRVIVEIKEISFFAIANVLVLRGLGRTELLLLNLDFACLLGSGFGFARFVRVLVVTYQTKRYVPRSFVCFTFGAFMSCPPLWAPSFEVDLSK